MEDLTADEWDELMSEPPGGSLHGRAKGSEGAWHYLDDEMSSVMDAELPQYDNPQYTPGRRARKPLDTIAHGRIASYVNDDCRCLECRQAWAAYKRSYRSGGLS